MKIINIEDKLPKKGSNGVISQVKYIVVHHDAQWRPTVYNSIKRYINQAYYHLNKNYNHLSYHFKIDNVGDVFQCVNLKEVCYHAGDLETNRVSLSICLDGYLEDRQQLTPQQKQALFDLLTYLKNKYPNAKIEGHERFSSTLCPGNNVMTELKEFKESAMPSNVEIRKSVLDKLLEIQKLLTKLKL